MKILITNDDGVYAPGLWALVTELKQEADVMVVAPDRDQSGVGTGITLHHPLRLQKFASPVAGVSAYAVCGTPGDSVIMGLKHLTNEKVDLVVSGINNGPNLGDDIFLSGTVGAALQGYLHGISSVSVSINDTGNNFLDNGAKLTADLIFKALASVTGKDHYFLNINIPSCPLYNIKGIKITRPGFTGLAEEIEEGHDGRKQYYWLKHRKAGDNLEEPSDAWAVARNFISITPLHAVLFNKKEPSFNGNIENVLQGIL